jgi:hypothetical protein
VRAAEAVSARARAGGARTGAYRFFGLAACFPVTIAS